MNRTSIVGLIEGHLLRRDDTSILVTVVDAKDLAQLRPRQGETVEIRKVEPIPAGPPQPQPDNGRHRPPQPADPAV